VLDFQAVFFIGRRMKARIFLLVKAEIPGFFSLSTADKLVYLTAGIIYLCNAVVLRNIPYHGQQCWERNIFLSDDFH